jgi:TonB family protein
MLLRPEASQGSKAAPIIVSLIAHMSVLAAVAFGPPVTRKPESAYRREIAPHEKKLVWYRFDKKLPEVSPPEREAAAKPPRADVKHPEQTIVSRSTRPDAARQTIIAPGPELKLDQELAAPNLLAFEMPKLPDPPLQPKLFVPSPPVERAEEQPTLEKGPELAASESPKVLEQMPKPPPRSFVPPPKVARQIETPQVEPADPRIDPTPRTAIQMAQVPGPPRPKPKAFTPPPQAKPAVNAALTLPTIPGSGPLVSSPTLIVPVQVALPVRPQPRPFTAPPSRPQRADAGTALPGSGPQVSSATLTVPVQVALPGRPQPFTPPMAKRAPPSAPELEGPPADLTAAVVGLNPIDRAMPVIPEGSRPAQFSAAPEISPKGGAGGPVESAAIVMPDLMIRGAPSKKESIATLARVAPTSRENLLAAGRPVITTAPAPPTSTPQPILGAVRVSSGPDPRFEGRSVFTVALQMPNVTSYSGSWILWYAERKGPPGEAPDILAPSPLRKVDPVYDLSAVDDRVEGKVQLSAVIHTDGYVYGITILRGVDARLDNSAVTALRKWEFDPARRDGVPVDVDVVIEIPFRLRPLAKK